MMTNAQQLSREIQENIVSKTWTQFDKLLVSMQIEDDLYGQLSQIYIPLAAMIQKSAITSEGTLIVGINGAQGSGKSTLCSILELILSEGFGLTTTTLSIDDLYLTKTERRKLSETVNPLLETRGVPGTHDTKLGEEVLNKLCQPEPGHPVRLPVFDKAIDDRTPAELFREIVTPVDIVFFEGWCVGACPQDSAELKTPLNVLEAKEDSDGNWRRYVNQQLASSYKELFSHMDLLILLKIPAFDCVEKWRGLQESKLAAKTKGISNTHIMDTEALQRFIMHYERLTRHILDEMPSRADIVLPLNYNHLIEDIQLQRPDLVEE